MNSAGERERDRKFGFYTEKWAQRVRSYGSEKRVCKHRVEGDVEM